MITRYLSIGLAAALLAFGVYHWILITGLKQELKTKDEQIAQYVKRIAFLEADNANLTKINADFKAKTDEQNAAIQALSQEQEKLRKQAAVAVAAAEQRARRFENRASTLAMAAPVAPDNLCESVEAKLSAYIDERLKERAGEGSK
jgi:chromosome segregation ATPase